MVTRTLFATGESEEFFVSDDLFLAFIIPMHRAMFNKDINIRFGGEAVSLAVNYTHADEFRASGYAPFLIDGTEYGAVREAGNFSFVRVYESGHQVPYFQRKLSLPYSNK